MRKYLIIIVILQLFLSCQKTITETDENIINQIFPELIAKMELSITKPFGPPPPLPQSLAPTLNNSVLENTIDSCINKNDFFSYLNSYNSYTHGFQKHIIESYAINIDSLNVVIGIYDTLYTPSSFDQYKRELPRKFQRIIENISNPNIVSKEFELNRINNSSVFKTKLSSQLGWYPRIDMDFWTKQNDFYLSGILSFSRIYFDNSKTYGIFYCTKFGDEKEPTPLLVCIKKTEDVWKIEETILR